MVTIKIFFVGAFLAFGIGLFFTNNRFVPEARSYAEGPPPGHTGAPGDPPEQTCNVCHAPNTGPGVMTIIAPANYVPGQTYQIQIEHSTTDMTRLRWGFEMTALDGTNSAAGTFTSTSPFTQTDFGNQRFYILHTVSGTFAGTAGGADWSFDWVAPATDVGPVTFYAAGNQADNDNTFDGDLILTTTTVTAPAGTPTPTDTPTATATPTGTPSISGTITYGNPASPTTKFISNTVITATPGPFTVTHPGPGQYVLTDFGLEPFTVGVSKTTGQNGISSNDAARIAQHVAGTSIMVSNAQKVAADVTNNGALSSNDAAQIARFVSGLGPPIGITNTWRFFVPPGPTFPVGASPIMRSYTPPIGNITGEDYIGLLIGEVTGNWTPGAARKDGDELKGGAEGRGPESNITVAVLSHTGNVDKEIVMPVTVHGIADKGVISYEFDLRYDASMLQPVSDAVEVNGTVSRGLSIVVNATEPGLLRVIAYGAMPIDENGVLLNLRFTAVGAAGVESPLSIERIIFNEGVPRVNVSDGRVELL